MKKDTLGDRIKFYESFTTSTRLMHNIPIIIRLDGCAFHTFTKGLNRPYDENLSKLMVETTKYLCNEVNAKIGYTQSDEITLIVFTDDFASKVLFDAKLFKLTSVLASKCSVFFNSKLAEYLPSKKNENPVFDCRIFNVPSKSEAANALLWRKRDAVRNSISMAAQSNFSHKELQGKSSKEMLAMLSNKGICWDDYPTFFKEGTFLRKFSFKFDSSLIKHISNFTFETYSYGDNKSYFVAFKEHGDDSLNYLGVDKDGTVFVTFSKEECITYSSKNDVNYKILNLITKFIEEYKDLPLKHNLKSKSNFVFERSFYIEQNISQFSEEIFN